MRRLSLIISLVVVFVLLTPTLAQDDSFAITIMHTNDTHAHHEPDGNGNGGAARQAAVMNQIRAEVDNSILLDGGDRFSGSLFHTVFQGQDQVQIMNALDYDAMALGNHEFDNGDEVLAEMLDGLNFPAVAANIDFSRSSIFAGKVQPYTIIEVGGERIGVIGLTTAETPIISSPGDELAFSDDYVGIANTAADQLTEMGVNKIVLLTHTGINTDLAIIGQLENIDVFIGGHSHTLYGNQAAAAIGDYPLVYSSALDQPILYVQAGEYNTYLGRLDLVFDADGVLTSWSGDTIFLSRYITPDPLMDALIANLAVEVEALRETPVNATTDVFLVGDRNVCRVEECNMGNLLTDAMRWETGAQIAILNGGSIRGDIDVGEITLGEVLNVQPFNNTLATFEATGADIIAALENGVSTIILNDAGQVARAGANGRFPQVSGLRYSFDPTKEPGSRIVSVEVLGANGSYSPIDESAVYSVVTNIFVRMGGDGYDVFVTNAINPYDFGRADYEVTAEYMALISPISIEPEGRITIVNAEVEPR